MQRARHALIDLSPLRVSPGYRRLWLAGLLDGVGGQVAVVAVLWQVWEMTRSPWWVGSIGLVQAVPLIVLGLVGGPLADVLDRRRVALWSTGGAALTALALAGQLAVGGYPLWLLLALISLQTACAALGAPSRRTFTARLLPRDRVAAGVALQMISFQVAMLAGPALGGALLAGGSVGLCYLANALSFLVSWYAVRRLPPMPPDRSQERARALPAGATAYPQEKREGSVARVWRRTRTGLVLLAEGVQQVRGNAVVRGSFLLDLAATLLAFPVALFPMVNEELFAGDPRTLGLFLSAIAVGGIAAGLGSGVVTRTARLGLVQLLAVGGWGLALLGFGLASLAGLPWLALAFLALAGAADTTSVTSRAAMVQLATPDHQLGRVSSVEHVIGVAGPHLGNARAGAVAGLTTPAVSAVLGAIACLMVTAGVALTHREVGGFEVAPER